MIMAYENDGCTFIGLKCGPERALIITLASRTHSVANGLNCLKLSEVGRSKDSNHMISNSS